MVSLNSDVEMTQITENMANLGSPSLNQGPPMQETSSGRAPGHESRQDEGEVILRNMAQQFKSLSAAMTAQGVFQVVKTFEGDPSKFKTWIKELEKYAKLVGLDNVSIPNIAFQTSAGSVGDFIKRYIESMEEEGVLSWDDLKKLLRQRFAEITDSQQAMALLRKTKQKDTESVQIYSERLLQVAEDAYPDAQDDDRGIVQQQLVNAFCDGLAYDYLKMKVMRENPQTLEDAVRLAMREQNLRKRFNLRKDDSNEVFPPIGNQRQDTTRTDTDTRPIVPMEIDHSRQRQCYRCKQNNSLSGPRPNSQDDGRYRQPQPNRTPRPRYSENHRYGNSYAPLNRPQTGNPRPPRPPQVLALRQESQENSPVRVPSIVCWHCNGIGHIRRNCPHLNGSYPRNSALN